MENRWYYKDGDKVIGPVDNRGLRNAAKAGDIKPDSFVRLGDEGKWAAAARVKGLFGENPPSGTAHPPISQVSIPPIPPPIGHNNAAPAGMVATPSRRRLQLTRWYVIGIAGASTLLVACAALFVVIKFAVPPRQSPEETAKASFEAFARQLNEDLPGLMERFVERPKEGEKPTKVAITEPVYFDVSKTDSLSMPFAGTIRFGTTEYMREESSAKF